MNVTLTEKEKQIIKNSINSCILYAEDCIKFYTKENEKEEVSSDKKSLLKYKKLNEQFLSGNFSNAKSIENILKCVNNEINFKYILISDLKDSFDYIKIAETFRYIADCFELFNNLFSQIEDGDWKMDVKKLCMNSLNL